MIQKKKDYEWLLFFYSVPSKPVSNRVKIWRRLIKAGAVQLKGAVYVFPYTPENFELCQWLVSEVASVSGDGGFVRAEKIEAMSNEEITAIFDQHRENDYRGIEKDIDDIERRAASIRKAGAMQNAKKLLEQLNKYSKRFEEIKKVDFFSSPMGIDIEGKIQRLKSELKDSAQTDAKDKDIIVTRRNIKDYQGRIWVTRKRPFVDRMASAWLIRKFIDKKAVFGFIEEKDMESMAEDKIAYDIRGGEFTHIGDLCTFEVLARSFNIKDRQIVKISELVHELDIKDDKYNTPEARGVEEILLGIRKTFKGDADILEKGMSVFEMLYASKI